MCGSKYEIGDVDEFQGCPGVCNISSAEKQGTVSASTSIEDGMCTYRGETVTEAEYIRRTLAEKGERENLGDLPKNAYKPRDNPRPQDLSKIPKLEKDSTD